MSDLHIPHEKEPRNLYTNSEDRPDIIFFDSETGQNLDVDVSLAHPWSQDTLKRASREDGFAARTREEKKMNKYAGEILSGGTSSKCVPLCLQCCTIQEFLEETVLNDSPKMQCKSNPQEVVETLRNKERHGQAV